MAISANPTLTVTETIAVARERHLASKDMLAAALYLPASYESELSVAAKVEAGSARPRRQVESRACKFFMVRILRQWARRANPKCRRLTAGL